MRYKKIVILTIILAFLLAISAVSAVNNATSDVVSVEKTTADVVKETTDEVVSVENDNQVISANESDWGTFDDLAKEINSAGNEIVLYRDYKYNSTIDSIYQTGVTISKNSLIVDGNGHTLDGNGEAKLLVVTGGNITLKNIVFTNSFSSSSQMDGAVFFSGNGGVLQNCSFVNISAKHGTSALSGCYNSTVTDCYFANNYARSYGHTVTLSGESTITNCIFVNNTSEYYGGAIYLTNDGNSTIRNCIFVNNTAEGGGAIHSGSGLNNIINCSFLNNHAKSWGGAMWIVGDEVNIIECYYFNNTARSGSAIQWYGFDGVITNSTFINNIANFYGAAIEWGGKYGKMITCDFKNNVPYSYSGDITIIKKQIFINMSNHSFYYNQPINLPIILNNVSFNSKVILNFFNGNVTKIFDSFINNNTISLSNVFDELNIGMWNVTVIFEGDDNYYPCNATATITVLPPSTSLTIDDVDGTVGHEVILVANVNSTLAVNEGIVTFFDGETNIGEANVYDNVATLTYTPYTAGEHVITAIFNSDNYLSSNSTAKLLVDNATVEVLVNTGTVGYNSTFVANVKGLYSIINEGAITFYISGEYLGQVNVVNGSANLTYAPLTANDYTVRAVFRNSDKFLDDESIENFKVNKANSEIMISDINATFGQEVTILVNVISSNNLTINEGYVLFFDGSTQIGDANVYGGVATLNYTPSTTGEHPITAMFYSNNYDDNINSALLNVSKASVDLSIDNILDVDFKELSKFTVHVTSNSNVINEGEIKFYVNDSFIGSSNIYDGVANFVYAANGGSYVLTVVYDGNDNYLASNQTANFVVNAIPTSLIVDDITAYYNDYSYLSIQLVDSLGVPISRADVLVYIDGVKKLVTDKNGQIRISVKGLTPKTHVIKVEFEGNANYTGTDTFVNVVINKIPSYAIMDDLNGIFGHELKITANVVNYVNALTVNDGKVVFFDGETRIGESDVVNGSASLTYIPLYVGSHIVNAVYCDSGYFTDSENNASLNVDKADSEILINNTVGTVGYDVSLTANVVSSNNLTINEGKVVFFDGETNIGEANVIEGVATLTYTPSTSGEHTITASFNSDNYGSSNNTALLAVSKADVELSIDYITDVYFTNPSNFAVNVNSNYKPVNEGKIKYYVNNELVGTVDVYEGNANFNYVTGTAGSFTLTAAYEETDNYFAKNASTTFNVNKMPTTLSGESIIFDEEAYKTFTTELKDNNNNGIGGQPVKIEVIKYSGESATFNGISDSNGITIYDVGRLAGGMWYVTGIYAGNNNYINSRFVDKFIVVRMNTTTEIEEIDNPKVNHNYKLKANIHDENGKLVKEGIVQFYLDGVDIGSIDLSKNQGHQDALSEGVLGAVNPMFEFVVGADDVSDLYINYVPTKAGKHTLTAVYEGTTIYKASNSTTSFDVSNSNTVETVITASDVSTVYNGGKYIVIKLKDVNGKAVSGVKVTVVLGGKTFTPTTKNGQAKVSTNGFAPVKTYKATITFKGNSKYDKSTTTAKVTVKKATPKLTAKAKTFKKSVKTKNFVVTLKTNQNKVMKNTKLTLKVNGKTYKATTNAKGQATFKITKLTKKGKFTATIKYAGSKYYNAKTVSAKITVK